jgi:hypothetical protein
MLSSEIDLLMYSTFAVQSDENARQQCLTFVLPYVLLWSNRAVIHLANDDSRNDPACRAESLEGPAEMFPNPTSRSGAPKSDNANVDATIHTIDEWVFKKAGKPRTRAGALFHVLQLLPDS